MFKSSAQSNSNRESDSGLPFLLPFVLIALLFFAACGDQSADQDAEGDSSLDSETISPLANDLITDAAEITTALSDPTTEEVGVWSILKKLGVGVYTHNGEPVMVGSESSVDDFWLYDFQIPLLVKMASQASYPFSKYHALLTTMGYMGSKDDLLAVYKSIYSGNTDAFLPSLFIATGLVFEGDPKITPLQEWLLILDTFVAPNAAQTENKLVLGEVKKLSSRANACEKFNQHIASNPLWGLVNNARSVADNMSRPVDPKDLINAAVNHVGVETSLVASAVETHEGHDGKKGAPVKFTAKAEFVFDFPDDIVNCGFLAGVSLPKDGPIKEMRVDWTIPGSLAPEHGTISVPGGSGGTNITFTDIAGTTWVEFTPKVEAADGVGTANWEFKTVTAKYNIQQALGNQFSIGGALQEIFNARSDSAEITIKWHEAPGYSFSWEGYALGSLTDSGFVYTCNYPEGPWIGESDLIGGTSQAGASILYDMNGTFEFNFPASPDITGKHFVEKSYTMTGTQSISANGQTVDCDIVYNKNATFSLNADTQNVTIKFKTVDGSVGCMGSSVPINETDGGETIKPLKPYAQCE